MFHLFKWEQPLYKALSHQRNKRQPQAILRGWKICVWLHPSPHQLSPTQRRRWVLGHRPEGDPRRGTWTKMQMPSWVSSSQTNWLSIITKYSNRKGCHRFEDITYFLQAHSAAGIMGFHHLWYYYASSPGGCNISDWALKFVFQNKNPICIGLFLFWLFDSDGCPSKALMTTFHFLINSGLVTRLRYPVCSWRQKAPVTAGLRYGKQCVGECYAFALTHIPKGLGQLLDGLSQT